MANSLLLPATPDTPVTSISPVGPWKFTSAAVKLDGSIGWLKRMTTWLIGSVTVTPVGGVWEMIWIGWRSVSITKVNSRTCGWNNADAGMKSLAVVALSQRSSAVAPPPASKNSITSDTA